MGDTKLRIKTLTLIFLGLFFISAGQVLAQGPRLPYKDTGACPFECCTYRGWVTNKDTVIYKEMRAGGSPVAFRVEKGEKVTGITGVVITTEAGRVKALKSFTTSSGVRIRANDIFYLLTYRGEGFYLIWYKGKKFEAEAYDQSNMKVLSEPVAVWWVKIRNRKGQIGWTKLPENFDNKDSCG
jgi:hypothetical protein